MLFSFVQLFLNEFIYILDNIIIVQSILFDNLSDTLINNTILNSVFSKLIESSHKFGKRCMNFIFFGIKLIELIISRKYIKFGAYFSFILNFLIIVLRLQAVRCAIFNHSLWRYFLLLLIIIWIFRNSIIVIYWLFKTCIYPLRVIREIRWHLFYFLFNVKLYFICILSFSSWLKDR